ncbi:MAG TPA: hypothetical protein V6C96_03860 [Vampirovibrionales bacterium]
MKVLNSKLNFTSNVYPVNASSPSIQDSNKSQLLSAKPSKKANTKPEKNWNDCWKYAFDGLNPFGKQNWADIAIFIFPLLFLELLQPNLIPTVNSRSKSFNFITNVAIDLLLSQIIVALSRIPRYWLKS